MVIKSYKRSKAAKDAWKTRRKKYGPTGVNKSLWKFNFDVFKKKRRK